VRGEATLTGFAPDVDISQNLNAVMLSNFIAWAATHDAFASRYRESWVARACRFPLAWLRVKMSLGPTPRCSDLYVVADVDALLGHWPITFSCLIQRGAFFFALMAS